MYNTLAKAKLVFNKKLQSYKLVVAFNVHTTTREDKEGNEKVVHLFPVQSKCAYVSGDLLKSNIKNELAVALKHAKATARTDNIVFVG
jgi:hypothetical protein